VGQCENEKHNTSTSKLTMPFFCSARHTTSSISVHCENTMHFSVAQARSPKMPFRSLVSASTLGERCGVRGEERGVRGEM